MTPSEIKPSSLEAAKEIYRKLFSRKLKGVDEIAAIIAVHAEPSIPVPSPMKWPQTRNRILRR